MFFAFRKPYGPEPQQIQTEIMLARNFN